MADIIREINRDAARDVGVATPEDAQHATRAGRAARFDLAEFWVDGDSGTESGCFVNTASLGGYPELVRLRETLESRWPKWVAFAIALARTLRRAQPLRVRLDGEPASVWMLFVGNGTYAPKGLAPTRRPAMDTGMLDVRYVRADVPYSRARFVVGALTNSLSASRVYRRRHQPALDVALIDGNRRLATDGEVRALGTVFRFRARAGALRIYRP
jgi:undecaprenyl-diphosphatase